MTKCEAFGEFWRAVNRAELQIRMSVEEYSPLDGELWDDDLAQAYDAISRFLKKKKVSKLRIFPVPSDVPGKSPFEASNAHQAIMLFLNPPEALYGSLRALSSAEFTQFKEFAQVEAETLGILGVRKMVAGARPIRALRRSRKQQVEDQKLKLLAVVRGLRSGDGSERFDQATIARKLDCSQPTLSKFVNKHIAGGWEGLVGSQQGKSPPRGFNNRDRNGSRNVDAYAEDVDLDAGLESSETTDRRRHA